MVFVTFAYVKEVRKERQAGCTEIIMIAGKETNMTTVEMNSLKRDLIDELMSIDNTDTLKRIKVYLGKLKNKTSLDIEDTIGKEEILAGIEAGLKDVKAGRTRPVQELLNELQ